MVSGFLAARAWNGRPEITDLVTCRSCGLRFFERGLDDDESANYYRGYRDDAYRRSRQAWEPFYTRRFNAALLEWSDAPVRRENLRRSLAAGHAPSSFHSVLDHGGSRGQMLADIDARRKAVFDPSAVSAPADVEAFSNGTRLPAGWALILSCQVLEHISHPAAYLRQMHDLLADDGWLYVEVPNEHWRSAPGREELRKALLKALLHSRSLLIAADMFCTASRIKLGLLPPLGFVAMREHLNFFTEKSLTTALTRNGFQVEACGIDNGGQLFAVARKFATAAAGCGNTSAIAA